MTTVYAKTLNNEWYDYHDYELQVCEEYGDIIVDGGREFKGIDNSSYLERVKEAVDKFYELEYYYNNSIRDFVSDFLPKKLNDKRYSNKELHYIKELIEKYEQRDIYKETLYAKLLSIIMCEKVSSRRLCGCCQGDLATCYYPTRYTQKDVDFIEAYYFGTGTEVMIHDEDTPVKDADDISGFTFLSTAWNIKERINEIKEYLGYDADDDNVQVVLYEYKSTRTYYEDTYELVK